MVYSNKRMLKADRHWVFWRQPLRESLSHIVLCEYSLQARSPVFSHLSSSLQGLSTIRAFKVQQRFQQIFDEYQDLHSGLNNSNKATFERRKNTKRSFSSCALILHKDFFYFIAFPVLPNRGLVLVPDHLPLVCRPARWNLLHFCHHHRVRLPLPPRRYCCVSPALHSHTGGKIKTLFLLFQRWNPDPWAWPCRMPWL